MDAYRHVVQYYETDKMGITHHSNYIRWMEEARVDFLSRIGWDYARLEQDGIISPVVEVSCRYRKSTTFADEVFITVSVREYRGVRLVLAYDMKDAEGKPVATAESEHCFVDKEGKLIRLSKDFPEFHKVLESLAGGQEQNTQ
ncbi:MAG: acyl-CoA thioesterase [Lachnospiraceae bacterium]|nr:acyl-CoA thioesterase [Lachnospiraceae bacterium]